VVSLVRPVRSASLRGYVDLAQSLGLDAAAMMRRVGLSPRCLDDPETLISTDSVRELLENSAQVTGAEDFALRMVERRSFSNLGPISLVLKEEPTPRQALETLFRYLRVLNPSLSTQVEERDGTVIIREELLGMPSQPLRQAVEMAVGVLFRILRELIGPQWRPLRVCFAHRPPQDLSGHRAFFGRAPDFNQEFNGLICSTSDLDVSTEPSDPGIARFARDYLEQALSRHSHSTSETVRQLIAALLPGGRCTAQQIAHHLSVDRRTIHRHLLVEGTTFSKLLEEVRTDLVVRQLRDSDRPLSELAGLLGFSGQSAFGHWFRSSFGCSVTEWRRRQPVPGNAML